jgi:hypothetical protein
VEFPKEYFQDSEKIWRAINIRAPESKEIKGTIAFLFGGYKEEPENMDKIVAGSKGVNTVGRAPNSNEIKVIEGLVEKKWRVLLFDDMQYATPDGTVHNEMWIEDYMKWINSRFGKEKKKNIFMAGFSSGAYIVGLHLQHLATPANTEAASAYGIFSYPVDVGMDAGHIKKKSKFETSNFERRPTLFLSGSSTKDISSNPPRVNGYANTKAIYDIASKGTGTKHEQQDLDTYHSVFEDYKSVIEIVDEWFDQFIEK